jgi:hypothetical protein
MTPSAREVLAFLRRVQARRLVLGVAGDAAIGIIVLVAVAMIRALATGTLGGSRQDIVLFGVLGVVLFGVVGYVRHARKRAGIALEVERRVPRSRNLIATSAELLEQPTARPDVIELVTTRAAEVTRTLEPSRLFPARATALKLAAALVLWAATLGLASSGSIFTPDSHTSAASPRALLGKIVLTVTPPAYTRQPARRFAEPPSRVETIAGSRITLSVEGTGVTVETVEGAIRPAANGDFGLTAPQDGFIAISAGTQRRLIGLTVTPDAPPRVRVTAPGRDMFIADAARRIPIMIDARDDIGLTALALRYTKISGSGEHFTFIDGEVPITIERHDDRDWAAKGTLDLAPLKLEQGDMVIYRGVAADGRPGAAFAESDAFIVEITSPLSIAAEGFSLDDQQDKYALSQQMVILKTERLLARAASLAPDSLTYYAQNIAAEQRAVRAEFVFMMGGEVEQDVVDAAAELDETREAQGESEIAAGRLINRGKVALVDAIRLMSQANTKLNNTDPKAALADEKSALVALEQAFSRTRYLLRALTRRERLDLSRRLTGVLTLAGRDVEPTAAPAVDPAISTLRRSLAAIATLSNGEADRNETSRIAQEVLSVDPSDSSLQRVAASLGESKLDDAATALAAALRARLPREDVQTESPELRRLRGALSDALSGRSGR